jgi:hypothetical protein
MRGQNVPSTGGEPIIQISGILFEKNGILITCPLIPLPILTLIIYNSSYITCKKLFEDNYSICDSNTHVKGKIVLRAPWRHVVRTGRDSFILNFDTGRKCSVLRLDRFTPAKEPGIHWSWGRLDHTNFWMFWRRIISLAPAVIRTQYQLAHSLVIIPTVVMYVPMMSTWSTSTLSEGWVSITPTASKTNVCHNMARFYGVRTFNYIGLIAVDIWCTHRKARASERTQIANT